jgi:hypothetical protein
MMLAACRDVPVPSVVSPNPGVVSSIAAVDGDHVNADPGADGAEPLTVVLRDGAGRAVPNARVTWLATEGGSVQEDEAVSDAAGLVRASWIFADHAASQSASVSSGSAQLVFHGSLRQSPPIPVDSLRLLNLTTFDGSGQVVHPDVLFLPRTWDHGRARLAMAITPYPYGDPGQENPSLFVSDTGALWAIPAAARNPVVRPGVGGYLSDPALVFDDAMHQLRMYYREVIGGQNVIRFVTTTDGVSWSAPQEVVRVPSHELVSPSVVRRSATNWLMWSVNAGPEGCAALNASVELRHSTDGVQWDAPITVALAQPGGFPWHIDVKWIGPLHQYWALYNLKSSGNCVTPAVYLATSSDGIQWTTYRQPVIQRGAIDAFADIVYRSSFIYTKSDDMVTLYFSGARWDGNHYVWSGALERRSRTEFLTDIGWSGTRILQPSRQELPNPEPFVGRLRQ